MKKLSLDNRINELEYYYEIRLTSDERKKIKQMAGNQGVTIKSLFLKVCGKKLDARAKQIKKEEKRQDAILRKANEEAKKKDDALWKRRQAMLRKQQR